MDNFLEQFKVSGIETPRIVEKNCNDSSDCNDNCDCACGDGY